jgi:hypothetical protein
MDGTHFFFDRGGEKKRAKIILGDLSVVYRECTNLCRCAAGTQTLEPDKYLGNLALEPQSRAQMHFQLPQCCGAVPALRRAGANHLLYANGQPGSILRRQLAA